MSLSFNEIEAYLHYYAGRFQNNRFEHDELVNEAWIAVHALAIPEFASSGIRWAMLNYIQRQYMQDHRGNPKSRIQSIDEEIVRDLFLSGVISAPRDKRSQIREDSEYINCLLWYSRASLADRLLIYQRYFQGLQLKQIAKIHGCTSTNIVYKLNKIIEKLKKADKAA